MTRQIATIGVWGVGLMGGSLGLALRKANPSLRLIGIGRNTARLEQAVSLGAISEFVLEDAARLPFAQMDVLLLAVPLSAMENAFEKIAHQFPPHLVVTDAGSAKVQPIAQANKILGVNAQRFVPAHPIAGREKSGVEAAIADLYVGKKVILTPTTTTDADAIAQVEALWQSVGAITERWDAQGHDAIYALVSHLPQLLATSFINSLNRSDIAIDKLFHSAGSGMRDFSRLASSDASMWRDICLANRSELLQSINSFEQTLASFKQALTQENPESIFTFFQQAKDLRNQYF